MKDDMAFFKNMKRLPYISFITRNAPVQLCYVCHFRTRYKFIDFKICIKATVNKASLSSKVDFSSGRCRKHSSLINLLGSPGWWREDAKYTLYSAAVVVHERSRIHRPLTASSSCARQKGFKSLLKHTNWHSVVDHATLRTHKLTSRHQAQSYCRIVKKIEVKIAISVSITYQYEAQNVDNTMWNNGDFAHATRRSLISLAVSVL